MIVCGTPPRDNQAMLFYTHDDCLEHAMLPGHPERPERLSYLVQHFRDEGLLDDLSVHDAPLAERRQLEGVHTPEYIDRLERAIPNEGLVQVGQRQVADAPWK